MRPRPFLGVLGLTLLALVACNAAIAALTKNSVPRQLLRRIDAADRPHTVAFGNSLVAAGFDAEQFTRAWRHQPPPRSLNAGLGHTAPLQHLQLAHHTLDRHSDVRVVIYGFFDFMLSQDLGVELGSLWGNHALSFYLRPEIVERQLAGHPLDRLAFRIAKHFPMYVERGTLWAPVEKLRRRLSSAGLPEVARNQFGNVKDFEALTYRSSRIFEEHAIQLTAAGPGFAPPIRQLIEFCRARGVSLVTVAMPMPSLHRSRFYATDAWARYLDGISRRLAAEGVPLVAAADWISDRHFVDNLHLDRSGAVEFSARLARLLSSPR